MLPAEIGKHHASPELFISPARPAAKAAPVTVLADAISCQSRPLHAPIRPPPRAPCEYPETTRHHAPGSRMIFHASEPVKGKRCAIRPHP